MNSANAPGTGHGAVVTEARGDDAGPVKPPQRQQERPERAFWIATLEAIGERDFAETDDSDAGSDRALVSTGPMRPE